MHMKLSEVIRHECVGILKLYLKASNSRIKSLEQEITELKTSNVEIRDQN